MTRLRRRRVAAWTNTAGTSTASEDRLWIPLSRLLIAVVVLALIVLPAAVPRAAAGEPGSVPFLQVRLDRVTPDLVTTGSEPTVTVSGTIANVGDRPVRDVVVRLEHAPAVASSAGLRTNLGGPNDQFQPVAEFVTVAAELQRGQDANFRMSYPLRSASEPSLGIDAPGVYPLLVNVNGTPDYGEPARLDDGRFLLPVLGVPPTSGNGTAGGDALSGQDALVAPDTSRAVQVTMLWPVADQPRLAPGAPGGTTPVRLTDDDLAGSLATGGRLDTLLGAAEFATSPAVDADGAVSRALCLAVDPDLLVTVNAMTAGYVVSDSPTGPGVHPGTGQAAAVAWLDRLRALAQRICVAPTTYAQADLDALQRVGDPALSAFATNGAGDIVDQVLEVTSIRGATLVGDGPLNTASVELLSAQGTTVAIAAADCPAQDSATGEAGTADLRNRRLSAQVVAAPFDPAVGAALAAVGSTPAAPSYLDSSLDFPIAHDSAAARRQDTLGSMLWRSLQPQAEPRTQILMPPLNWGVAPEDAQAVLTALATTIHSGLAVPRPLPAVIADAAAVIGPPQPVSAATDAGTRGRFDDTVVGSIRTQVGRLWGLTAAMTTDPRTGLTGVQYTAPLREDMLRALSQAEPPSARNGLAEQRMIAVTTTVDDLFGAVTIVNPGGSYTLATERSPLPLALRNDLAVPIRVRVYVDAPPGMTVTDIGEQELPPGYLPLRVPVEVHFTQRVAIDVSLRTPDGLPLGEPVRLSVHSNAYGKVLFFITVVAAAVLITLMARRLWHRFRGQPDRADLDRPEPNR